MNIPTHWCQATAAETDGHGRKVSFSCWRSSQLSKEDAQKSALTAATAIVQKLIKGEQLQKYGYGDVPLREEVIQRFTDAQGELFAAVTRNGYGSLVLNTASVQFIDLDFPYVSFGEQLRYFFAKLFGRKPQSPETRVEVEISQRVEQFIEENPAWGLRLYRTAAGMRALVTHDLFSPSAESTLEVLGQLGSDPLYVRLCKMQECFRARLTPKPWRFGLLERPVPWPRETEQQQDSFGKWLDEYSSGESDYSTCRFLGSLGNSSVHDEVRSMIEVHDKLTRCDESLPLA
jgi:hypothetical protein